jgi:hypothetical protein
VPAGQRSGGIGVRAAAGLTDALAWTAYMLLAWASRRLTRFEISSGDPWEFRELPWGLWRVQRVICRALERLEGAA